MKNWGKILIGIIIILLIAFTSFYFSHTSGVKDLSELVSIQIINDLDERYYVYSEDKNSRESYEIKLTKPFTGGSNELEEYFINISGDNKTELIIFISKFGIMDYYSLRKDFIEASESTNYEYTSSLIDDIGDLAIRVTGEGGVVLFFIKDDIAATVHSFGPHFSSEIAEEIARDIESKI